MPTLTGTYTLPNGDPASGVVEIIPSEKQIVDIAGNVILSGRVKVTLDADGHFTVDLPATDDVTLIPTGFGYTAVAKLHHTHLPAVSFPLPASPATVDISDVTQVLPSTFDPTVPYLTPEDLTEALDLLPAPTWTDITSKPTTFKPDVTDAGLLEVLDQADTVFPGSTDLNTLVAPGNYFLTWHPDLIANHAPIQRQGHLTVTSADADGDGDGDAIVQTYVTMGADIDGNKLFVRHRWNQVWSNWRGSWETPA